MGDYLKCVQEDITKINNTLLNLKKEYDRQVNTITKELRLLETEEDKILKRTQNLVRCSKCNKFGTIPKGEFQTHYRSSEMGGEYECPKY